MSKVSLQSQIAALEQFVGGTFTQFHGAKRSLHRDHMQAALDTLRWLQRNEASIKAATPKSGAAA